MNDLKNIVSGKKMWWCMRGILDPIPVVVHQSNGYDANSFVKIVRCDKSLAMGETRTVSIKTVFNDEIEARIYAFKIMSDLMIQENINDQRKFESVLQFLNIRTYYSFEEMSFNLEKLFNSFLKTHPDLLFKHLNVVE